MNGEKTHKLIVFRDELIQKKIMKYNPITIKIPANPCFGIPN